MELLVFQDLAIEGPQETLACEMVVHNLNPSAQKAEAGGPLNVRPAWSIE